MSKHQYIISFCLVTIGLNALIMCSGARIKQIHPEWAAYLVTGVIITLIVGLIWSAAGALFNGIFADIVELKKQNSEFIKYHKEY